MLSQILNLNTFYNYLIIKYNYYKKSSNLDIYTELIEKNNKEDTTTKLSKII
jgi:hypothetical protein